MRTDRLSPQNVFRDLSDIVAAKRGDHGRRLRRLQPHLPNLYRLYFQAKSHLETISVRRWSEPSKKALHNAYAVRTQARTRMVADFETAVTPAPFICPYCLMRQPKSIDHFLPKEQFPEYSVLAWNLVLVCDPCNRLKGDRLISPVRSVLNPYFDPIPADGVLYAVAVVAHGKLGLRFEIRTDPAEDPALVALLGRHVEAFGLLAEYRREASAYTNGIVSALLAQHRVPIVQAQLERALDVEMRRLTEYPVNAWQIAIIDALETEPGLLGFVNQKIQNTPLPPRPRPRRDLTALRAAAAAAAA